MKQLPYFQRIKDKRRNQNENKKERMNGSKKKNVKEIREQCSECRFHYISYIKYPIKKPNHSSLISVFGTFSLLYLFSRFRFLAQFSISSTLNSSVAFERMKFFPSIYILKMKKFLSKSTVNSRFVDWQQALVQKQHTRWPYHQFAKIEVIHEFNEMV